MAGLYIHIPFCHSKCVYCDFVSTFRLDTMKSVVNGIVNEFEFRKAEVNECFNTIYFGGGTPSILPAGLFERIISRLPVNEASEITIEVNPEDVTPEAVDTWRSFGINRVSMGVQSLHDEILRSLGRRHSARKAIEALDCLVERGISNISVDLIYGIPGMSESIWREDLRRILRTEITHLSAYCLTYHAGTMLERLTRKGKMLPVSDDIIDLQFRILRNETINAGFEHYEISNFSKPGYKSKHNSLYWHPGASWLGIGPSAHSFDGKNRRVDFSDISDWIKHLPTPFFIEEETDSDRLNDYIVTSLRTSEGLNLAILPDFARAKILENTKQHIEQANMYVKGDHLCIHPSKWLLSDLYIRDAILI